MPGATCYVWQGLNDAIEPADYVTSSSDLVGALAAGDRTAIRRVYKEYHEQVRAFARRLLGVDADAEEVVQEVFLALPRGVKGFQGKSTLGTFIMGMAVNHARHALRASARRRSALKRFAEEVPVTAAHGAPDEFLVRQQLADRLLSAMDQLNEEQRVTFVLCEVEERSSSEVAEILGIPSSTVRARVSAAREKLRVALGTEAEP
jgi:RNA polymerase sigma-70 factor (ECF subfamily)